MNKDEMVNYVASAAAIPKTVAEKTVDAVFEAISKTLTSGSEVRLVGFGTFVVSQRRATEGRNPRTGEKIHIPASKSVKFRAGKGLKDAVN